MNTKKKIFIYGLSAFTILGIAYGITFNKNDSKPIQTAAYDVTTLPTTIDLNAVGDSTIRSYYSSVSGKNGNNLLIELKNVLSNGQKYYSYDVNNGQDIWKIYKVVDRDWEKSPASETKNGTYDASTNTITNFTYKTGKEDPYVHALYVDREIDNPITAWANHQQTAYGINREHIWPKSRGFNDDNVGKGGARGDPMHLWPGDGKVNGAYHNNYAYGYVDTAKSYKDSKNEKGFSYTGHNLLGVSKTLGSGDVFEPQDSDKGDIARACFYMVARYNNLAGNDSAIDNYDNPNLFLEDTTDRATIASTATKAVSLGLITDLLEWNRIDPVDEFEIKRNDLLYKNFTNNRNPFIDFPQWADIIWGNKAGTASPSTDSIHGGEDSEPTRDPIGLEIASAPTTTIFNKGQYITPAILDTAVINKKYDDEPKAVKCSSSELEYSIDNGTSWVDFSVKKQLNTIGEITIWVRLKSKMTLTDSFKVTVGESLRAVTGIKLENPPSKTTYNQNDFITSDIFGTMTVNKIYSLEPLTEKCLLSELEYSIDNGAKWKSCADPTKLEQVGKIEVKLRLKENTEFIASFNITVNSPSMFGCLGSLTSTSIILSSISLIGVVILIIRKKKIRKA